jgi:hypothetical protein
MSDWTFDSKTSLIYEKLALEVNALSLLAFLAMQKMLMRIAALRSCFSIRSCVRAV